MNLQFPTITIPQPGGAYLVKPGRPVPAREEVSVREFSEATGMSERWVTEMCERGAIKSRRLTPAPKSKRMIPSSEIQKMKNLQ